MPPQPTEPLTPGWPAFAVARLRALRQRCSARPNPRGASCRQNEWRGWRPQCINPLITDVFSQVLLAHAKKTVRASFKGWKRRFGAVHFGASKVAWSEQNNAPKKWKKKPGVPSRRFAANWAWPGWGLPKRWTILYHRDTSMNQYE